jgi:hypothetical protein
MATSLFGDAVGICNLLPSGCSILTASFKYGIYTTRRLAKLDNHKPAVKILENVIKQYLDNKEAKLWLSWITGN